MKVGSPIRHAIHDHPLRRFQPQRGDHKPTQSNGLGGRVVVIHEALKGQKQTSQLQIVRVGLVLRTDSIQMIADQP